MTISIGPSKPLSQFVQNKPIVGRFLIDTGASVTCVDSTFLAPLNLTATGVVDIHTPSTNGQAQRRNQYDVSLYIPPPSLGISGFQMPVLAITETHLRKGQGIDGLIGRDVLAHCVLFYNGPNGIMTLCY